MIRAALTALAVLLAFPAFAQEACGPVEGMEEHFKANFGERIVWEAVNDNGQIFVFFVNDETQSWTIVIHDGIRGCVVAMGNGVNMVPTGMAL